MTGAAALLAALSVFGAGLGWLCWRHLFGAARARGAAGCLEALLCLFAGATAPLWAGWQGAVFDPVLLILGTGWVWTALILALSDARVRRLPDPLTAALLIWAALFVWQAPGQDIGLSAAGALVAVLVFWAVRQGYRLRRGRIGLGLGDVKVMAGLALMLGPALVPWATLLAAVAAALITGALAALRRQQGIGETELPFGLYLCLSAIWVWGIG